MSADDAARRIRELEEELREARLEAELYKESTFSLIHEFIADDRPTDEEITRMLTDTTGTPVADILAEFVRGRP